MTKPKALIAFGSPSDLKKFPIDAFPLADLKEDTDVEWYFSDASAHRIKGRVAEHFRAHPYDAIIAGAGFTNGLVNDYIGWLQSVLKERPHAFAVGLPIKDSRTGGLSSLLSSSEFPPGISGVTVSVEQLANAINVTRKLVTTPYDHVSLFPLTTDDTFTTKATNLLDKLKVRHTVVDHMSTYEPTPRSLPLVITDGDIEGLTNTLLLQGTGAKDRVLIATQTQKPQWDEYAASPGVKNVVTVGLRAPDNLAHFGAKIIARNNPEVGRNIVEQANIAIAKYDDHKEVVRLNPD